MLPVPRSTVGIGAVAALSVAAWLAFEGALAKLR
jgi:hypothetical protein